MAKKHNKSKKNYTSNNNDVFEGVKKAFNLSSEDKQSVVESTNNAINLICDIFGVKDPKKYHITEDDVNKTVKNCVNNIDSCKKACDNIKKNVEKTVSENNSIDKAMKNAEKIYSNTADKVGKYIKKHVQVERDGDTEKIYITVVKPSSIKKVDVNIPIPDTEETPKSETLIKKEELPNAPVQSENKDNTSKIEILNAKSIKDRLLEELKEQKKIVDEINTYILKSVVNALTEPGHNYKVKGRNGNIIPASVCVKVENINKHYFYMYSNQITETVKDELIKKFEFTDVNFNCFPLGDSNFINLEIVMNLD